MFDRKPLGASAQGSRLEVPMEAGMARGQHKSQGTLQKRSLLSSTAGRIAAGGWLEGGSSAQVLPKLTASGLARPCPSSAASEPAPGGSLCPLAQNKQAPH